MLVSQGRENPGRAGAGPPHPTLRLEEEKLRARRGVSWLSLPGGASTGLSWRGAMTIELIQAIVGQTTVLIAQLATSNGWRAPLAHLADQVFQNLVTELERQGVSRKVSADMFGMGLRSYQRRVQRLTESSLEPGRSLWEAVLDHIRRRGIAPRADVLRVFAAEDDALLRGVLRDLCDSQLVFQAGQGAQTVYRATSDDELGELRSFRSGEGLDELVWAIVYREGPVSREQLIQGHHLDAAELGFVLERLVKSARVERTGDEASAKYRAANLYVPLGSEVGWEAAIFDHFQAMVKTILCRLREDRTAPSLVDRIGGSTYTLDVWPGHPLEERAYETLGRLRAALVELRQEVEAHNAEHPTPDAYNQVVLYVGQCVIQQDGGSGDESS